MGLNYAIIGTGMMGQEHIRNVGLLPDASVSTIIEPNDNMAANATQLAVQLGMRAPRRLRDVSELVSANNVDAVVVVSPNDTHFGMMQDLLHTSFPILLEKPSATSVDHAWELTRQPVRCWRSVISLAAPVPV